MNGRFFKKLLWFSSIAAGVMALASLLQTSFFPFVGLFGAVPDLVLVLVCGAAFYLGPVDGALLGLIGGVMIEAFGGYGIAVAPLLYLSAGLAGGWLSLQLFRGKFWHFMIYSAGFCLFKAIFSFAYILFSATGNRPFAALWFSVLPEFAGTLLLAAALAVPARLLAGILRGRIHIKKGKGGLGDL